MLLHNFGLLELEHKRAFFGDTLYIPLYNLNLGLYYVQNREMESGPIRGNLHTFNRYVPCNFQQCDVFVCPEQLYTLQPMKLIADHNTNVISQLEVLESLVT